LQLRLSYAALKVSQGWQKNGLQECEQLYNFSAKAQQKKEEALKAQQAAIPLPPLPPVLSSAPSSVALGKRKQNDTSGEASKARPVQRVQPIPTPLLPPLAPNGYANGYNQAHDPQTYQGFWQAPTLPDPRYPSAGMYQQRPAQMQQPDGWYPPQGQPQSVYSAPYPSYPIVMPSTSRPVQTYGMQPQQYMSMPLAPQQQQQYPSYSQYPAQQQQPQLPSFSYPPASPSRRLGRPTDSNAGSATDMFLNSSSASHSRPISTSGFSEVDSATRPTLDDLDVSLLVINCRFCILNDILSVYRECLGLKVLMVQLPFQLRQQLYHEPNENNH